MAAFTASAVIPNLIKSHLPGRSCRVSLLRPSQTRPCFSRTVMSAAVSNEGSGKDEISNEQEKTLMPMPMLYSAWFPPGHQISSQMRVAIEAAIAGGRPRMEINFPVVPNLEEINFGTKNNFEFGKYVANVLGMDGSSDYQLIKRYLGQFCNLYWCLEIAKSFPERTVWAVFTDGVSKEKASGSFGNLRVSSFRRGREPKAEGDDVVIIVDPRPTDVWKEGEKLAASRDSPLIFLNSQFNETYGLVGPRMGTLKDIETVYFLKRVTRGYAFRAYPDPWQAILELPDSSCEVLKTFESTPKLSELAGVVRMTSNDRFGAFNDRYAKGFGGRL